MDPLGDVLDGVRARHASFCRLRFDSPWALLIADDAPLALITVAEGRCWIEDDVSEPVLLDPGDVALVRGPEPYRVVDEPSRRPTFRVGPLNALEPLDASGTPGPGDDPGESTVLVSGTYTVPGDVGRRLLTALPRSLVVRAPHTADAAGIRLLGHEVATPLPAQSLMLDRLLDVALVETLRAWFASRESEPPGWYQAYADPLVAAALALLHGDPARAWTMEDLAAAAGTSRATLARRFRDVVGEPAMGYLAGWRVTLAADLLRGSDLSLDAVARRVGYADGFALSRAFRRLRGTSPGAYRSASGRLRSGTGR